MDIAEFSVEHQLTQVEIDDISYQPDDYEPFKKEVQNFKSQIAPGDVIYQYTSDREAFDAGMGSAGYIAVREGQIVADLVEKIS